MMFDWMRYMMIILKDFANNKKRRNLNFNMKIDLMEILNRNKEDIPIINSPFWPFEELGGYNKENGVDIRNIVLKSSTQFNMYK